MTRRNEYSWTSIIEWYADRIDVMRALDLYGEMQKDNVIPSKCTFLALLRACIQNLFMIGGLFIHHEVVITEFEEYPFLGSSLVHLYAKCGSLAEAHCVFHMLHFHDVITWTVLIIGYAEFGEGLKALCCFAEMMVEGITPNSFTIVAALKACKDLESREACRVIHIVAVKKGFETEPFIGSALMDIYAKFHLLVEAHFVFDKLPLQDVTSWNALITGYVENHLALEGLRWYKTMTISGVSPDIITYCVVLKACCHVECSLGEGQNIYARIVEDELEKDLNLGNVLMHMYVKHDLIEDALQVMLKLPIRDVVSWNTLLAGYVERDLAVETLKCLRTMAVDRVSPDEVTFLWALRSCSIAGTLGEGLEIHSEIVMKGYEGESKMINGKTVFECNSNSRVSLATSLIAMYGKCSMMSEARWVFDAWPNRPLVAWNAIITGYTHQGKNRAFLSLLEEMTSESILPDDITFLSILTMCSFGGHVDYACLYFEIMRKVYNVIPTIKHYGCMVDLLGRSGQLDTARIVADKMPFQPDLPLYSTMLGACHKWHDVEIATAAFDFAKTLDETHFASFLSILNIYTNVDTY